MPAALRMMLSRIAGILARRRLDARLAEEVETHLALLADELERGGMSPADARVAARRAFGGVDQLKERHRDARSFRLLEEIGIRMAVGARASQVLWLFLRAAAIRVALGLALGIAGAVSLASALRGVLIRIGPTDPITIGGISALFIAIALVATYQPARRAARMDPLLALRRE